MSRSPSASHRLDRRLRAVFRITHEGLLVVDDDRRYVVVNDAAGRLLAAPVSDVVGSRLEEFTPPEDWRRLERFWRQLRAKGESRGECEVLQRTGSRQPIAFHASWDYAPGEHLIALQELRRHPAPSGGMTAREREIIRLVAAGYSTKEIAKLLVLRPATVKTHLSNIYSKLGGPRPRGCGCHGTPHRSDHLTRRSPIPAQGSTRPRRIA
jgi:PAS domain S-box-containing protein